MGLFNDLAPQADCYLFPGMVKERYGLMGARGTMSRGTTVTDRCAAACRPVALHRLPPRGVGGWVGGISTAASSRVGKVARQAVIRCRHCLRNQ